LFIVIVSWLWRAPNTRVPDELIGEWHTTDPNYADRSFEIDTVSVSFRTGGAGVTTGFIKNIRAVPAGSRTLYTITYSDDETTNEVSFFCDTAKGIVIRFKNQENIAWTKVSNS
jgi:hypothetical protein